MQDNAYTALAAVYDALMADIPYKEIADAPAAARRLYGGREIRTVLDLGCGTGALLQELKSRGYDTVGVDASEEMLSTAFERFADEADAPLLLAQDMRALDLYDTVDCAISSLDCINYLPTSKDLAACFSRVSLFLNEGGFFLFDVNTPYKFRTAFADRVYVYETDDVFCTWQNDYHEAGRFCDFYLSVFALQSDGRYIRSDEVQREYAYSDRTIEKALERAGLSLCGKFADYLFTPEKDTDERRVFIARKPEQTVSK